MQNPPRASSKSFRSGDFTPARRLIRTRHRVSRSVTAFTAVTVAALALTSVLLAQVQTYTCRNGFGPVAVVPVNPAVLMQSLKTVENPVLPSGPFGPVRDDLVDYIAN